MSAREHDVIAAEVHRKALENLTNEMAISLVRTSGSPVVVDAKDFSTCLMDTTPEHLGFAAYVLLHLGTSLIGTRRIADRLRQSGDLRPGDGWIVNDPHEGGAAHQGDVAVIMPMFHRGEHLGWGFVNMHILDVGGSGISGIAPDAHDVYAEGLRFPGVRMIRDGAIEPAWEEFLEANVRVPGPVLNDVRSMIAANNVGARKLGDIVDRFGVDRFRRLCDVNKDLTERVLRERIAAIPDGVYEAVEWNEFDGHGGPHELLQLRLRLEVDGSDLRFAFSGVPQIDGFVNAGIGAMWGQTISAVLTTLGYGDLPVNGGIWRPITIDVGKPGTIVNAALPAPVSDGHAETGMRACKLAKDVLSQALSLSSDPVLRGRVGGKAHDGPPVNALFGGNQHGTVSVVFYLDSATGIGGGAQSVHDGQDAYGCTCMTGCGLTDLEAHEAADPLLFLWRRIVANSGGPGQYRGGQGMEQAFLLSLVDQMAGPSFQPCAEVPASGFGGGFPGAGSTYYVVRDSNARQLLDRGALPVPERLEGTTELLRSKVGHLVLRRGDALVTSGGGGGGLGDPLLRDPQLVAYDVRSGWVTAEHADAAYGVVLSPDGTVDAAATAQRRDAIREQRLGAAPAKSLTAPESPGVAVAVSEGGGWCCGSCGEELGDAGDDWRSAAVLVETEISARYAQLKMYVRPHPEDRQVVMREHYCPACAQALSVNVVTDDAEPLAAPELAAAAPA